MSAHGTKASPHSSPMKNALDAAKLAASMYASSVCLPGGNASGCVTQSPSTTFSRKSERIDSASSVTCLSRSVPRRCASWAEVQNIGSVRSPRAGSTAKYPAHLDPSPRDLSCMMAMFSAKPPPSLASLSVSATEHVRALRHAAFGIAVTTGVSTARFRLAYTA